MTAGQARPLGKLKKENYLDMKDGPQAIQFYPTRNNLLFECTKRELRRPCLLEIRLKSKF